MVHLLGLQRHNVRIARGAHNIKGYDVTRAEYLFGVKDRANVYIDADEPQQAWQSVVSDLRKRPSIVNHAALMLGMMLAVSGHMETTQQVRKFVDGIQ